MKLSIIVCTYNRSKILKYCLDSLEKQSVDKSLYEVIVVDNNSTDNTKQVVEEYCGRNANFRYVFEKVNSSSIARNTGSKVANGLWLGFIDDDARCPQDYVEKAMIIIDQNEFDCFGGRYVAWFKEDPPKWLNKSDFGSAPLKIKKRGVLKKEFLDGTSLFVRKKIFLKHNGFSAEFGINGKNRGYGEETDLVARIRGEGLKIGYDPDLLVEHLVNPVKYSVFWNLKDIIHFGKTEYSLWIKDKSLKQKLVVFKGLGFSMLKSMLTSTVLFIKSKNYYWQNFIIDIFKPFLTVIGYLRSIFSKQNKR